MTGEVRMGRSGPMAISSRFGWILCGRSSGASEARQPVMTNFVNTESVKATLDNSLTSAVRIQATGIPQADERSTPT